MPFVKGQSGNPNGSNKRQKRFGPALERAIKAAQNEDGTDALDAIAKRLIDEALNSENPLPAIKEIADRLDGKPEQAIGNTSPDEAFRVLVGWVSDKQDANE